MDALVMCGGRGTRLDISTEKPLLEIADQRMIERVLKALEDSSVDAVYTATSPHVPETRAYLAEQSVSQLETPGDGYVEDLEYALERIDGPILTIAADLPLIEAGAIDHVLDAHEHGSLTVCVPVALKQLLGVSVDLTLHRDGSELAPTGINVVSDSNRDTVHVTYDVRFAVNVNQQSDAYVAERLA